MTGSLHAEARPVPGPAAENRMEPVPRRGKQRPWSWVAVLGAVVLGAGLVLLGALWVREVDTAPTEVATAWVSDMADGRSEQAQQQICAQGAELHPTGASLRADFERFLGGRLATADPGEQVISSEPADVGVHVAFKGVMADGSRTRFDVTIVREEGRWVVCGYR
jgi:hypothetical protein